MRCCTRPESEPLYVIVPYFNFCGFKSRRRLFTEFINRNENVPGIRLVVVESMGPSPLPHLHVWKHVQVRNDSTLWIKENLINIGEKFLPKNWVHLAWLDADILFLNQNWVDETKEALEFYDVVQLFQSAVNLGPRGETIKVDKSFGYMHSQSGTPYTLNDKYGFWHPGYAWACNRGAWKKMGGLIDWAILGSADRHMAMAWAGISEYSRPGNMGETYKQMISDFQAECKGFRLGNINGTILHEWHGRLEDRKYKERWSILIENKFDPVNDIGYTREGVLQLTDAGKRMEESLKAYFVERKEDS